MSDADWLAMVQDACACARAEASRRYELVSVKGSRIIEADSDHDAIAQARAWQDEIQAAYGVSVTRNSDGAVIAEID